MSARTSGGPVIGDVIQVHGVSAFFNRTFSVEADLQLPRSVLYFSAL